jgi:hypothetical protein
MTQTDVLSMDVLSPRTFCPHGRFVPMDVLSAGCFVRRTFCPTDILSPRTFCPTDVLSLRTFCPHGRFVPTDVLSTDVLSPDILSPDVLSGHRFATTWVQIIGNVWKNWCRDENCVWCGVDPLGPRSGAKECPAHQGKELVPYGTNWKGNETLWSTIRCLEPLPLALTLFFVFTNW